MPAQLLINNGQLKSDKELAEILLQHDVDTQLRSIILCDNGSKDASVVQLALQVMGNEQPVIFWGGRQEYLKHDEPDMKGGGFQKTV